MIQLGLFLFLFIEILGSLNLDKELYSGTGEISFVSNAPLEIIKAKSDKLKGAVNLIDKTFAYNFPVNSFEGFNSPLQKEHFNEHYLETEKYPNATFSGKIVGFELQANKTQYEVFAKGKMTIHGQTKIMTIPVTLTKIENRIEAESDFLVNLSDFGISIPTLLEAKISPTIEVTVQVTLFKNK